MGDTDTPFTWREISSEGLDKVRRGAPFCIGQGQLLGSRDHLVWLLESSWGEVGWELGRIRTAADVRRALASWQQVEDSNYSMKCLLRPSEIRTTAKRLNAMRRERTKLNDLAAEAFKRKEVCRESLERVQRVSRPELSASELLIIENELTERARVLEEAEQEMAAIENLRLTLEARLQDGEAYFARHELTDFCTSKRYEITPLSTANAIAGLPYIGWRQSMKRCKPEKCPIADGLYYQVFKLVCRIVRATERRQQVLIRVETWLRSKTQETWTVLHLRENWYYLRRAIEAALKGRVPPKQLPFVIVSEYQGRIKQPSAADYVLAENERILVG